MSFAEVGDVSWLHVDNPKQKSHKHGLLGTTLSYLRALRAWTAASRDLSAHHFRMYRQVSSIDGALAMSLAGLMGILSARRTAGLRRAALWMAIKVTPERMWTRTPYMGGDVSEAATKRKVVCVPLAD
jgi:hypothetical protein